MGDYLEREVCIWVVQHRGEGGAIFAFWFCRCALSLKYAMMCKGTGQRISSEMEKSLPFCGHLLVDPRESCVDSAKQPTHWLHSLRRMLGPGCLAIVRQAKPLPPNHRLFVFWLLSSALHMRRGNNGEPKKQFKQIT